jgi:hypothetical protein
MACLVEDESGGRGVPGGQRPLRQFLHQLQHARVRPLQLCMQGHTTRWQQLLALCFATNVQQGRLVQAGAGEPASGDQASNLAVCVHNEQQQVAVGGCAPCGAYLARMPVPPGVPEVSLQQGPAE